MLECIDVSVANGKVNWQKVAAAGINFAYAKATEGLGGTDPTFYENIKGILATGMPAGAYHYLKVRHGKLQDADAQANAYCDAYMKAGCTAIPMLDCEDGGNKEATPQEWLIAINMFVKVIEARLGCKPFLYTYPGFWGTLGPEMHTQEIAELKLWIAHYTHAKQPDMVGPWTKWFMWQYAASLGVFGRVDGVSTYVDRSRCVGTIEEIIAPTSVRVEKHVFVEQPAPIPAKPRVVGLQTGDSGEKVKAMQEKLNVFGYSLVADGVFGPASKAAVQDFQKKHNIEPSGVWTDECDKLATQEVEAMKANPVPTPETVSTPIIEDKPTEVVETMVPQPVEMPPSQGNIVPVTPTSNAGIFGIIMNFIMMLLKLFASRGRK